MGKLFKAAQKHSYAKATFKLGDESIELLVKLFNEKDYENELKIFRSGDNSKGAAALASYFLDPETLEPAIDPKELLSEDWKNADTMRLFDLFIKVNSGAEGN